MAPHASGVQPDNVRRCQARRRLVSGCGVPVSRAGPMKIVIPGGTGQVGTILHRAFADAGHEVVIVSRRPSAEGHVAWDGETPGEWADVIDGSDVVINLAGRSVNCRYTKTNLTEMMRSRVRSARVVGEAIAAAPRPPRVWLQMSTATIYAHRFDAPNDEATGVVGGWESGVPGYWAYSVDIATAWERELNEARTPRTRRVALRSAIVLSPDRGGAFDVLSGLARVGLGGRVAGGKQYMLWIHDHDFVAAVRFLIDRDDMSGPVNLASPGPEPQQDFMRVLRDSWGGSCRLARHEMDGRTRCVRDPFRHRTSVEEPSRDSRPSPHGRLRVQLQRLGACGMRPCTARTHPRAEDTGAKGVVCARRTLLSFRYAASLGSFSGSRFRGSSSSRSAVPGHQGRFARGHPGVPGGSRRY